MVDTLIRLKTLLNQYAKAGELLKPLASLLETTSATNKTIAVGLSGGADSAMLVMCLASLVPAYGMHLKVIHIHHGLQGQADVWAEHCQRLAETLKLDISVIKVSVDLRSGLGIEAAARNARYQAFIDFCKQQQMQHFVLAHHLNDQAETLLMRLLRGTGVQGMVGMKHTQTFADINFHRPWLSVERTLILDLAQLVQTVFDWQVVQDPSNLDLKYKRGVLRRLIEPSLDNFWPAWKLNLARHANLMAQTQELLNDLAKIDFQTLAPTANNKVFSLVAWRDLTPSRQINVLRYWLSLQHVPMPTEKRLEDWLRQLRQVHALGFDRQLSLKHKNWVISVHRGRVTISE